MVNRTADVVDGSGNSDRARRYQEPWSRSKSLVFLVGMLALSALLAHGGIYLLNLTIVGP